MDHSDIFAGGGALYSALATIWEWPYGTEIGGTIAAITAFLGAILQISSAKYKSLRKGGTKK